MNNKGNYSSKRIPKPPVRPLEPSERFARLAATYETHARPYRWKQQKGSKL